MILRKYRSYSITRVIFIVICLENWISCAPGVANGSASIGSQAENKSDSLPDKQPTKSSITSNKTNTKVQKIQARIRNENETASEPDDNIPDNQNFFQSFAPLFANNVPLGHSRPLLYPEHSFKPSYKTATFRDLPFNTGVNDNILGSGNFGVVKGGTYYAEERDDADFASDSEPYAYIGSSPGRLQRKKNPPPAFRDGGDFFAHFRDFADITSPSKSYSQYVVVYANKNATSEDVAKPAIPKPKNIIEQLEMLDENEPLTAKESKLSKFKRKLMTHGRRNDVKEKQAKSKLFSETKEIPEPLIALS